MRSFRTDNAGKAWTPATGDPKNVAAVTLDPTTPGEVYAVTVDGTLYHSADGDRQWDESR